MREGGTLSWRVMDMAAYVMERGRRRRGRHIIVSDWCRLFLYLLYILLISFIYVQANDLISLLYSFLLYIQSIVLISSAYILIERTPPPGGVSFEGGSQTQSPEVEEYQPQFSKSWCRFSEGVLFLRTLHLGTTLT